MRTAIFVYQSTTITISTCETDLELSGMSASTVTLSSGSNALTLAPGIYKIVSGQDVGLSGDTSAFEFVVTTHNKDNDPTLPPPLAAQNFPTLDTSALHAFLSVPEAKAVAHP
jgi:hypothetical protein